MENLAAKYRPKTWEDVSEQSLTVDILKKMCESDTLETRNFLLIGPAGTGKAQPLYSNVFTTHGYVPMRDIKIGDEVFTSKGAVAKVSEIYPQGERDFYKITLDDQSDILVADNHLNCVYEVNNDNIEDTNDLVIETLDLVEKLKDENHSYFIELPTVDWEYSPCELSPYDYGVFLSGNYSSLSKEAFTCLGKDKYSIENGICKDFLYNSLDVRKQLLKGLIDNSLPIEDCPVNYGSHWLITFNSKLSQDIELLVKSQGIVDTVYSTYEKYINSDDLELHYTPTQFIHVIDYDNDEDGESYIPYRKIESIEYMGKTECQCIMIDHPDHTYISDGFIPTHNTTSARILANMINQGNGEPIEIDAASHSGVDHARELVSQMSSYPVNSKYKVFIHDECFSENTLVHTTTGLAPIKDIKEGDIVYNMTGEATVSHVFKNTVKTEKLLCVNVNGKPIITTCNHLFFTDDGWVEAKDLKAGDVLYDYTSMRELRESFSSDVSQRHREILQQGMSIQSIFSKNDRETPFKFEENLSYLWKDFLDSEIYRCCNLFQQMWREVEDTTQEFGEIERTTCKALAVIYMSNMWCSERDKSKRSSEDLLTSMRYTTQDAEIRGREKSSSSFDEEMRSLWEYISSELRKSKEENLQSRMCNSSNKLEMRNTSSGNLQGNERTYENKQSRIRSRNTKEDECYQKEERYIDTEACYALWKRTLFTTSDSFEKGIRGRVGTRISCQDSYKRERQPGKVCYELQTRPCLTKIDARNRGGWDRPQYEIATVFRRKESNLFEKFRVDSIESYQRGSNDELFQSYFQDTKIRDAEYVNMYDLEIDGHPSYYVEDILVHNCHSYSSAAWQSFLKVLEEQPAKTINVFCTTNPEKIPATILSRVQVFQLSKISLAGIEKRLKYIIECENKEGRNITYTDEAISYIGKMANGGMRDSITLLDKALAYSTDLNIENLAVSLGLPNYDDYFTLLNGLAQKDNKLVTSVIHDVYNSGTNFIRWFEGFHSFICQIIKYIYLQDINKTMIPSYYQDKISKYGPKHAMICLLIAKKLIDLNRQLKTTQYLQEVAITSLCDVR